MWLTGLVAPRHVGSSRTRARTRVPCIDRQILNNCATREAPCHCIFNRGHSSPNSGRCNSAPCMSFPLLRNPLCGEKNGLSTVALSPDPRMNFTLRHPESKQYANVPVHATIISQTPGNDFLCSDSPRALKSCPGEQVPIIPFSQAAPSRSDGGKGSKGQGKDGAPASWGPCAQLCRSPASPGCQSAGCQWCQDHFHSQLP